MNFLRENLAYILLALVAIILVLVTISLQAMILSTQPNGGAAQEGKGIVYLFRQQLAQWILPATDTPLAASLPNPTSPAPAPPPTNTPIVIVVQPTVTSTSIVLPTTMPTTSAISQAVSTPATQPITGSAASAFEQLLKASNVTMSEDNTLLAVAVTNNRLAIGLLENATYTEHQSALRRVNLQADGAVLLTLDQALSIVVSKQNTFVDNLTLDELRFAFTSAQSWSDIRPDWPAEPIKRAIPAVQTAAFAAFIDTVFSSSPSTQITTSEALPTPTATALPAPTTVATEPTTPTVSAPVDLLLGYVERDACPFVTEVVALALERELKLRIERVPYSTAEALFAALAATDATKKVDLTLCYTDPDDRAYLQKYFGFIIFVGGGYRKVDAKRYLVVSNAPVKSRIERKDPCLYSLLTKLNFAEADLTDQTASFWYDNHIDLVHSWTQCK